MNMNLSLISLSRADRLFEHLVLHRQHVYIYIFYQSNLELYEVVQT